ncbi:hypothetical protein OIO90_002532 [Microbotryomycetes sp. JL221]|nr:hypothetical protein OIO90_002532 [Microbotryomycetes sp. JL221]
MPPLLNDLKSLLPSTHPAVSPLPTLGDRAPPLPNEQTYSKPTIIAFVRHCGCPFAEKELKTLAEVANESWDKGNDELRAVVVSMSPPNVAQEWFESVGGLNFKHQDRVRLISDPDRTLYGGFGLGLLSFGSIFGLQSLKNLRALASSEGIVNTATRDGSNRWQNSGGFAIDEAGVVKWLHVASDASDVSDWRAARRVLLDY